MVKMTCLLYFIIFFQCLVSDELTHSLDCCHDAIMVTLTVVMMVMMIVTTVVMMVLYDNTLLSTEPYKNVI